MKNKFLLKLFDLRILSRLYNERLGEPLVYNIVSLYIFLFGNFRQKVKPFRKFR
jgi:hypothetical protein